jgi:serine/threonine protein phosphatase PrpC
MVPSQPSMNRLMNKNIKMINGTKINGRILNRKITAQQLFAGGLAKREEGKVNVEKGECKQVVTTEDKFKPINVKQMQLETAVRKPDQGPSEAPKYQQLRTNKPPVCYFAKQGPRDSMEDTFQIMHFNIGKIPGTFYGVFDGHGGKDVSYELVHMTRGLFPYLIQSLEKVLEKAGGVNKNVPQIIKSCFLEYDKKLFERKFNAGSTAVVVLNFNRKLYLINLGDSRGMVFTKNKLLCVSDDHKPQKPRERNRIYRAGHFVNPFSIYQTKGARKRFNMGDVHIDDSKQQHYMYLNNKWEPITVAQYNQVKGMNTEVDCFRVSNSLALSRAFGDFYLKTDQNGNYIGEEAAVSMVPDISEIDLNKYKGQDIYVFMASDGFWDVNRNTLALRHGLSTHVSPQKYCQELVDSALEKGSTDNTTVVFDKIRV